MWAQHYRNRKGSVAISLNLTVSEAMDLAGKDEKVAAELKPVFELLGSFDQQEEVS